MRSRPERAFLKDFRHLITLETREPVAFFSYPDKPSLLKAPGALVHGLVEADEDSELALEMLADALGLRDACAGDPEPGGNTDAVWRADPGQHCPCAGPRDPRTRIVVDESLTTGRETMGYTMGARPHDLINNLGGSIGYGTPVATGAALACPDRRTFCMVGDGSAMYTIQSLWTQAREQLPVTTIIFANNSYNILKAEYANMGAGAAPGPRALSMIDIDRPTIDWCAMAKSMGVPAVQVETAEDFTREIAPLSRGRWTGADRSQTLLNGLPAMSETASETLTLKTNLAPTAMTAAIHDGRVSSDIVKLDLCGPDPAQGGFKDMVRRNLYDCGELAIVTYLQAKCYNKPLVLLPAPVSGRFQHHCAGFNRELGHLNPKDIEGKQVGVRTYAQTTGLWIRGILQHEYGVDLDKVTWMTVG